MLFVSCLCVLTSLPRRATISALRDKSRQSTLLCCSFNQTIFHLLLFPWTWNETSTSSQWERGPVRFLPGWRSRNVNAAGNSWDWCCRRAIDSDWKCDSGCFGSATARTWNNGHFTAWLWQRRLDAGKFLHRDKVINEILKRALRGGGEGILRWFEIVPQR